MCNLLHFIGGGRRTLGTNVSTFSRVMRFKNSWMFLTKRGPTSHQFVLFVCACVCVCFVALPSMLLIRVGLHCDPPHPPREEDETVSLFFNIPAASAKCSHSELRGSTACWDELRSYTEM